MTVEVVPVYTITASATVTATEAPNSTMGCMMFMDAMITADSSGAVTTDTACTSTSTTAASGRRLQTASSYDVTAALDLPLNATDASSLNESLVAANAATATLTGLGASELTAASPYTASTGASGSAALEMVVTITQVQVVDVTNTTEDASALFAASAFDSSTLSTLLNASDLTSLNTSTPEVVVAVAGAPPSPPPPPPPSLPPPPPPPPPSPAVPASSPPPAAPPTATAASPPPAAAASPASPPPVSSDDDEDAAPVGAIVGGAVGGVVVIGIAVFFLVIRPKMKGDANGAAGGQGETFDPTPTQSV